MAHLLPVSIFFGGLLLLATFELAESGKACKPGDTCGDGECCCFVKGVNFDVAGSTLECTKQSSCNFCSCSKTADCGARGCCCGQGPTQVPICLGEQTCTITGLCKCDKPSDCTGKSCCCRNQKDTYGKCQKKKANGDPMNCPQDIPVKKC